MKRLSKRTVALTLILVLAASAFVLLASGQAEAMVSRLLGQDPAGGPGGTPTGAIGSPSVDSESDACNAALEAVIEIHVGKTGIGGGRIIEIAFDDDARNAYAPYACTLGPFEEGARWLVTLPVIVRTTNSTYRTSYLVKIGAADGSILDLSRAAGYRRMV